MGDYPCPCSGCWCGLTPRLRATADGLWLDLEGTTKKASINLLDGEHGPIVNEVLQDTWAAARREGRG
mgnify:CR=1 FL=1